MQTVREWFSAAEIAAAKLPGMPTSLRGVNRLALERGWRTGNAASKLESAGGRPAWEYHISLFSGEDQLRLLRLHSTPANDDRDADGEARAALWARFEALSSAHKADCEKRLMAIQFTEDQVATGALPNIRAAIKAASKRFDVAERSLYRWRQMVAGLKAEDRLAGLARSIVATAKRDECHPAAWDALVSDYLRPEAPRFSACYRRMVAAAKKHGWEPVPSERSLRRRAEAELSRAVRTLARKGKEKTKVLFPAQRRTRDHFHAMQAVNMDGHKLDVFVMMEDGTIVRLYLLGIQDLYSSKILAWRLCDAENKHTVRLVIGDMVERYGIPDSITLDNGRAFASKQISGGAQTRYRFKVREEEPVGLLVALGIDPHWTLPYSGQSKPIERAWRDLAEEISRHPVCAGAFTGNRPDAKPENYNSRAVPIEVFRQLVADQIAEHNARSGRRGGACKGRSFDETFSASIAEPSTIVRWPTPAQRSLWMLAADRIRAQKGSGEIHLLGNRYWAMALNAHAGRMVTVRFDPDDLTKPIKVYTGDNSFICDAEVIGDVRFDDVEQSVRHAKARNEHRKALVAEKRALAKLSAQELAALYSRAEKAEEPQPQKPKVVRMTQGNLVLKPISVVETGPDEFNDNFGRAMELIEQGASIHPFPRPDRERD